MAILINPEDRTVIEVPYDGSLEQAYALIGCELVEQAHLADGNVLLVDEEGLFRNPHHFQIRGYHQPLAGKALMVKGNGRDWKDHPLITVEEVRRNVYFHL